MKVLATYSIKGGVGKTSAAVNLAAEAAGRGWRVLLWDLDPQGGATYLLRVSPKVKGGGRALVSRRRTALEVARATDVANLDLVPADFRYRHLDLELSADRKGPRRLGQVVAPLAAEYDWVILDCAPSVSLVTEGVLAVADGLLVPVIPSTLSTRTLDQLKSFVSKADTGAGDPAVMAFFSMVDIRKRLHRDLVASLPVEHPEMLVGVSIPSAAVVERMGVARRPLGAFAPRTPAWQAYVELWDAVEKRWPEP